MPSLSACRLRLCAPTEGTTSSGTDSILQRQLMVLGGQTFQWSFRICIHNECEGVNCSIKAQGSRLLMKDARPPYLLNGPIDFSDARENSTCNFSLLIEYRYGS
ncbi:hypothetical protein Pyn_10669 [Prunus yedoensis var. nudiflora]|uniref:Uncharacterized protein n=1 Tax=Prunus yedoensis var. nudiflora TaxID=2094558 RepID=A0A314ZZ58_PRUYE|nr:hypothetical protein Pyn_10669 [Prunus yedoensis var. nudiflora]